ncbi:MAG: Pycsar system effector family protein [Bacteroidota bacterium]
MTENQLLLLQEAEAKVTDLLTNKLSKSIRFHTLQHTQDVVAACEKLADHQQLPEEDKFALLVAAWFHDTGYTSGVAKDHEKVSIQIVTDFLTSVSATDELKNKVTGCINATRIPQTPITTIERLICDADLFHLGTDSFKEKNSLLREEFKEFSGKELSKKEWRKLNIRFLEGHKYFSDYAREKLGPVKVLHLAELKENEKTTGETRTGKKDKGKQKDKNNLAQRANELSEAKKKKEKESQSERGMATVFRIMANNHSALSQMADSKANILISVNSIILSIMITSLFEKLQTDPNLQIPVALIAIVCVASIVFSILATRPNVSGGTFTREDIAGKKTNLLFFGNFHNMSLDDYNWGMTEMLNDKYYMSNSMIKDNYFLGVVLAKKYRFLRFAYNIFMYGLIVSILAFVVAFMLPNATVMYTAG